MEEYKTQSTPKIKLKELREKYRQEWNAKGEINFFNGMATPMAIFNWFVTELKLKEDSK